MSAHTQGTGSVAILLTAMVLARKLGKKCSVERFSMRSTTSKEERGNNSSGEVSLFDRERVRRTCTFVYSIIGGRECTAAVAVGVTMYLRSLCDLRMVHLVTAVESAIVNRNKVDFKKALQDFLVFMAPVSALNALLSYSVNELALCLREKLSLRLLKKYTQANTFYEINAQGHSSSNNNSSDWSCSSNLGIRGANGWDQVLTHDVEEFTFALAGLFSHILKPTVDIFIFTERLWSIFGSEAPGGLGLYMLVSGIVLNVLRAPHGRFSSGEQAVEGSFRSRVARVDVYAEQVASLSGGSREFFSIRKCLAELVTYVRDFAQFRCAMSTVDGVLAKYSLSFVGWQIISKPFLGGAGSGQFTSTRQRYEHYHTVSRMMVNLSSAIGSILLSGRDVVRCLGMGYRIAEFDAVLTQAAGIAASEKEKEDGQDWSDSEKDEQCAIHLDGISVTPPQSNERALIRDLSLVIKANQNVLISGPNGCGKSSLLRVISGLWKPHEGTVKTELMPLKHTFYLPQMPYMSIGSLRDQVIYPHMVPFQDSTDSDGECSQSDHVITQKIDDEKLCQLLEKVGLLHLVQGGAAGAGNSLDRECDWTDSLSGGEKQRLSMARLYYHKPQFAFLDECTSAVSSEVEDGLYEHCTELGITLITVSHRASAKKWHDVELKIDMNGAYSIEAL